MNKWFKPTLVLQGHDREGEAPALPAARSFTQAIVVVALALLTLTACDNMSDQPKFEPLERSDFFDDKHSARSIVEGTVARGTRDHDTPYYTGKAGGKPVVDIPADLTPAMLGRGRERYDIFCSPCHGRVGDGRGMIVQRGFPAPPSLHEPRLRDASAGHYFDVITNGYGRMLPYSAQVPVDDRWAIIAYIRALQLSQHATVADVPEGETDQLEDAEP